MLASGSYASKISTCRVLDPAPPGRSWLNSRPLAWSGTGRSCSRAPGSTSTPKPSNASTARIACANAPAPALPSPACPRISLARPAPAKNCFIPRNAWQSTLPRVRARPCGCVSRPVRLTSTTAAWVRKPSTSLPPSATSSCGVGTASMPTSWLSSSTTRHRASPTSCAAATCCRAPPGRCCCSVRSACRRCDTCICHLPWTTEALSSPSRERRPPSGDRAGWPGNWSRCSSFSGNRRRRR